MSDTYALFDGVSLNEIDGKTVLFSLKTGDSFGLNESAAIMLKKVIDDGFSAALDACAELFEADRAIIETDLRELLAELEGNQLLKRS